MPAEWEPRASWESLEDSSAPSDAPSEMTGTPTWDPTFQPTAKPTSTLTPTMMPTSKPTSKPTLEPTSKPTSQPTSLPTLEPTFYPTLLPTPPISDPTMDPTPVPTSKPTLEPTSTPTLRPTVRPTSTPSFVPTLKPTDPQVPSTIPTFNPTYTPTGVPTFVPTVDPPTGVPTFEPTEEPTPAIKPDIPVDTLLRSCQSATVGFFVFFVVFAVLRYNSSKGGWARKIFAPRLLTARIPPKNPPKGIFTWIRSLSGRTASRRVLDEVGLDAFMMNRLLVLCCKTFLYMTPCCLFVLVPLYATEASPEASGYKKYTIDSLLESHSNDGRIWAAVVMTYVNSVIVLYFLHDEYKQYIRHRHEFLRRLSPSSYTVLVERIPKALCSRPALLHYFRKIFGNRVLTANVVESDPMLNYAIRKRLDAVANLERALYTYDNTGKRPWRLYFPWMCGQIRQRMAPLGVFYQVFEREDTVEVALDQALLEDGDPLLEDGNAEGSGQTFDETPTQATSDSGHESNTSGRDRFQQQNQERRNHRRAGDEEDDDEDHDDEDHDDEDDEDDDEEDQSFVQLDTVTSVGIENFGNATGSEPSTIPNASLHDSIDEERAYLENWQRDLQAGGYMNEHSGAQVNSNAFNRNNGRSLQGGARSSQPATRAGRRGRRRSYCLWLMAHFNICMYIDSIKSYKRELKVWNRRVKRLQQRAERRRRRIEEDAINNVVIPSQQVVQDQFRLRLKQERKSRRSNNYTRRHSSSGLNELRQRSSAGSENAFAETASSPGVQDVGYSGATGFQQPNRAMQQQQQQQQVAASGEPDFRRRRSVESRPPPLSDIETATRSSSGRSSHSAAVTPLAVPWDDGQNALLRSLLAERKHSEMGLSSATSEGDDESEYMLDDDDGFSGYATSDDGQVNLFEHAGLDDILRYAVDQNERTSAFITFSSLTAAMAAAQSTIDRPLKMSISVAPDVRDVLWENLGLPLPVLALFTWLIRTILAAVVVVFGTITASLAALTNLTYLQKVIPGLREWLAIHGQWIMLFQELTPMMMVVLYTLVPPIINFVLSLQRRRFMSEVQIEFFQVYYYFLLIQVFLFYTVAGGLTQHFSSIVNRPIEFLSLMGRALPSNQLFFLQYFVTRTFLLTLELLRVADISIAVFRGMFVSSRTARDRRTPCCGWSTIDHPPGGNIERTISNITLCFSIGLCYSVICPPMTFVALIFFLVATLVYRNQLLYVYTHEREGGGLMFPYVFRALITSVVIFQLVMLGIFSVQGSPTSVSMMIPLVFLTLSFMLFCENAYERPSRFLPLGDASELDIIHGKPKSTVEFQHPSLKAPAKLLPESSDADSYRLMRHGSLSAWGDTTPTLNDSFAF